MNDPIMRKVDSPMELGFFILPNGDCIVGELLSEPNINEDPLLASYILGYPILVRQHSITVPMANKLANTATMGGASIPLFIPLFIKELTIIEYMAMGTDRDENSLLFKEYTSATQNFKEDFKRMEQIQASIGTKNRVH